MKHKKISSGSRVYFDFDIRRARKTGIVKSIDKEEVCTVEWDKKYKRSKLPNVLHVSWLKPL